MADDDKDFIEKIEHHSELVTGSKPSQEDIAKNFMLYGLAKRVDILKDFDASMEGDEIDGSPDSLRKYVNLRAMRKQLGRTHDAMRKAKR